MAKIYEGFTEENSIKLINEFRIRPTLWDPKDPMYYNKREKQRLWEEVSDNVGLDVDAEMCKRKMVTLMSSFRREKARVLRKLKHMEGEPTSKLCLTSWFAFDAMSFLLDRFDSKSSNKRGSPSDEEQEGEEENLREKVQRYYEVQKKKRIELNDSDDLNSTKQEFTEIFVDDDSMILDEPLPSTSRQVQYEENDEIKSFTNYLAVKMRTYNRPTCCIVQKHIFDVLYKADMGLFDKYPLKTTQGHLSKKDPLNKGEVSCSVSNVKHQPESGSEDEVL